MNEILKSNGCVCDLPTRICGKKTKQYIKWTNMIKRCYSEKYHQTKLSYKDCTISEEWKTFSNFKTWFDANYIDGYELDKDLKVKCNKHYSKETCLFIPRYLNSFLSNKTPHHKTLPTGVTFETSYNKYVVNCNDVITHKQVKIGRFSKLEDAANAYRDFKNKQIDVLKELYPEFSMYLDQHKL